MTEELGAITEEIKRDILGEVEDLRFRFGVNDVSFRMDAPDDVDELYEIFDCDPLRMNCLFNLERDPCERINLAKVFPELVKSLQIRLKELKKTVAKPLNLPGDPSCDPTLYNGTWSSWRDDDTVPVDCEEAKAAFVTAFEKEFLSDNTICRIVFSPFLYLFDDSTRFFIHDNSYSALAILLAFCIIIYYLTKRFVSFGDLDAKRSAVPASPTAGSTRFVKR